MDKTLVKGVSLLETLLEARRPSGVTELAHLTGLNPSNVHRTLQTWRELGFVAQDRDSGAYRCTLKLFEWGCRVADSFDVRDVAREPLAALAARTRETIHLAVLDGCEIVYLDRIDSPQPVRAYSVVGGRAPAHCVATGKALLAHGDERMLLALPDPLPRPTPASVADLDALRAELALIRRRGVAVNHEGWRSGVSGLGAPVFDTEGRPVAAVGLSLPTARFGEEREHRLADEVVATAREVSAALAAASGGEAA